jgi:murein L,D-transpeptidase YcbB/YkuD
MAEGYTILDDSSRIYDELLVEQVKLFQENSGLKSDGVIGKLTIKAFNESAQYKLNKLRVNMERNRWVLEDEMNEFIIVNIAKYQLYYLDSGRVTFSTKVMVGTDEKQTPVFRDDLQYVVYNPTWTLPTSISSKETLPQLKRDSLYLEKHNMVIINAKGEIQSDSGIVWSDYSENYFPFILRQQPGPGNALGRVKFLFPNKYAIYLHDTPSRYLFAKEERAFSHGCIRMQNPLDFSEFLLQKQDTNWTMDSIRTVLDSAVTMSVRLKKSIPIYIMYWTAGVNEFGNLFFVPDIYGRDRRILQELKW